MTVPTRPSNRHLYETMQAWGWVPGKSKDGFVEMTLNQGGSLAKICVSLPGHGEATRDNVIKQIVQVTTKGNREKFWNDYAAVVQHASATRAVLAAEPQPNRTMKNRGIGRAILDVLIADSGAMSAEAIHKHLPRFSASAISNSCSYLVESGNAERVMRGMYRATSRLQSGQTMHHDVQGGVSHTPIEKPFTSAIEAVPTPPPSQEILRAISIDAKPKKENDDETMNLLLDLMFPTGFKASHLPAIDVWKKSTVALMKEVRS